MRLRRNFSFKYKFRRGQAITSHGLMIAKMAGLPKEVLNLASEKAALLTNEKKNVDFESSLMSNFNSVVETLIELGQFKHKFITRAFKKLEEVNNKNF